MNARLLPGFEGPPKGARRRVEEIESVLRSGRDSQGRPLSPAEVLSLHRQKERLARALGPFGETMESTLQRRRANAALLNDALLQRYLRSGRYRLLWMTTGAYDCDHCAALEATTPDQWPDGLPPPAHPNCDCVVLVVANL